MNARHAITQHDIHNRRAWAPKSSVRNAGQPARAPVDYQARAVRRHARDASLTHDYYEGFSEQ